MFSLALLLPIPALDLESFLSILWSNQSIFAELDRWPVGVQIVVDDWSSTSLDECVSLSDF